MKKYPLAGFIISFIIGIISFYYFNILNAGKIIAIAIMLFGVLMLKYKSGILLNLFIYFLVFTTGYWITFANTKSYSTDYFGHYLKHTKYIVLKIKKIENKNDKRLRYIGEAVYIYNNKLKRTIGELILNVRSGENNLKLQEGEYLIISNKCKHFRGPFNPYMFNTKEYRSKMDIYLYVDLDAKQIKQIGILKQNIFVRLKNKASGFLYSRLNNYDFNKAERGIINAIIIGQKTDTDRELTEKYANVGIIHILCISGLHVGIVFMIIGLIIKVVPQNKKTIIFKTVLAIILLWLYVICTGMSASAQRAGIMFSLLLINNTMIKEGKMINALINSAIISLCINPYDLFNLGFQLSYLAVLGIAIAYQPICKYLESFKKNFILSKILKLTALSISAQIFIFPLIMFYFNNFPVWFLILNILIVPLLPIIIVFIILLLLFSYPNALSILLFNIVNYILVGLNSLVIFFDNLQFEFFQTINLNIIETILIYTGIVLIITAFNLKKSNYILASLLIFIFLISLKIKDEFVFAKQKILTIYNIPKHFATSVFIGKNAYIFCNEKLIKNKKLLEYNIRKYLITQGIKTTTLININETFSNNQINYSKYGIIAFCKHKIVIIKDKKFLTNNNKLRNKINVNFLIDNNKINAYNCNLLSNHFIVKDKYIINYYKKDLPHKCFNKKSYNLHNNLAYIKEFPNE